MKKQIPNIITSLNLLCGITAVMFIVSGDLITASFFAFTGIFFDFFDGLAARLLHAQSNIGLQLDSLADMITSGVVPALVMVQLLSLSVSGAYLDVSQLVTNEVWNVSLTMYIPFVGLLIAIASAYRLAKFNIDTRQTSGFIGLPTPANTLFILSLPLILHFQPSETVQTIILNTWGLIVLTLVSCLLLNAEIRLFALKFSDWSIAKNLKKYIFIAISIILLLVFKFISIPFIILFYLLLSVLFKNKKTAG